MNKIITYASILTLAVNSAFANMSLEIGGEVDAQVGFRNEANDFEFINPLLTNNRRKQEAIVHDTTLQVMAYDHIDILGGLHYGAKVVLEADTSRSKYNLPSITNLNLETSSVPEDPLDPIPPNPLNLTGFTISESGRNLNRNAREVMVFFEGDWGRVEAGNTYGSTKKMQIDGAKYAAGNGGFHGDSSLWLNVYPLWGNMRTPDFYTNKTAFYHVDDFFLPAVGGGSATTYWPFATELATAAKVSYYSPNINGFTLGATIIPDTDINGTVSNISTRTDSWSPYGYGYKDVIEGGITYEAQMNDVNFAISVLGQKGRPKQATYTSQRSTTVNRNDLGGYELGLSAEYMGFGFAASYSKQDALLDTMNDLEYYTLGVGYSYNAWSFSVSYMEQTQESRVFSDSTAFGTFDKTKEAEFNNLVFDIAYQCQGFMPYLQVASFEAIKPENADFSNDDTPVKNDGTVVLLGAKVSF